MANEEKSTSLADIVARPAKICDIVMKGGVTSGVVYPLAVVELAKSYTIKNIGGTSAGAIAAAATAAAEFGRQNGVQDSFARLAQVPGWLGTDNNLFSLFQPSASTKPIFKLLSAGLWPTGKSGRFVSLAWVCVRNFPGSIVLGMAPGLILAVIAWRALSGTQLFYAITCSVAFAFLVSAALVLRTVYRRAVSSIPANFYGLCSGYEANASSKLSLTSWLNNLLNSLAGKEEDKPLTFGDLWGIDREQAEEDSSRRVINLQMMTTSLSHGRPYRLPFETKTFYFDPGEIAHFFPTTVVNWMVAHARPSEGVLPTTQSGAKLVPLPRPADLPVILATRMSLSFPLLISAVPLYAVDFTRVDNQRKKAGEAPEAERCWFSDGGICSNFPVHFFDQPLPKWPTFAINLKPFHPDHTAEEESVWMASSHGSGWSESWIRFDQGSGAGRIGGFSAAIFNAMQNWMDNSLSKIPGYRDRIVHVSHSDQEGGLNLSMPSDVVSRLSERGRRAGILLRQRFCEEKIDPAELSWNHHRWIRYRSTMAVLEEFLESFRDGYEQPLRGDRTYGDLISRRPDEPPGSYRWDSDEHMQRARGATQELAQLARDWSTRGKVFDDGAPRPEPELRIRPRI